MTPLIDVVFILLVFFMLASRFLDYRAMDLRAPGGGTLRVVVDGVEQAVSTDGPEALLELRVPVPDGRHRVSASHPAPGLSTT